MRSGTCDLEAMVLMALAVRPAPALVEQGHDRRSAMSGGAELFHECRLAGQVAVEDPPGDVDRRDERVERQGLDRHRP